MTAFTFQMANDQRDFIEAYRQRKGLLSVADAARELIYIGSLAVADS